MEPPKATLGRHELVGLSFPREDILSYYTPETYDMPIINK
jgi:hypothetical protein